MTITILHLDGELPTLSVDVTYRLTAGR